MSISVRSSLALGIASALCITLSAQAGNLIPGESATVNAGDPVEAWTLNGATLMLAPGATTRDITAGNGSRLQVNGASISGTAQLSDGSVGTFNSALVNNSSGAAAIVHSGSELQAMNSEFNGSGDAIRLTEGGILSLVGSRVTASGSSLFGSAGISFRRTAQASVSGGSLVQGDDHAVTITNDPRGSGGPSPGRSLLSVDGSHLASSTGSAIHVTEWVTPAQFGADIVLRNGTTVSAGNGVLLDTNGDVDVSLTVDDSVLAGDIVNGAGATTHVRLQNQARLTGAMSNVSSLALDASTWVMNGDSSLGRLDLGNGTVSLGDGSTFNTLTVAGDFIGNDGTIVFNTVLADDSAATDRLVIEGDTVGTANVRVNNVGGAGAQTRQGIELISVGGASNGQFNLAGRAVGGQYEYFLFKGTGADGNWYLRSQLPTQPDPCETDPTLPECNPVLPGPDPDPVLRPEPGAYLANLQAAQTMFRIGYHDRHAGQNAGRAWARVDGSRNGFDAISRQLDIRGNSQALNVGADLWRHDSGSSVGVMLSSGNATSTSTNELTGYYARGKVKGEALGVYGTWRGGNDGDPYAGFYVDGSVQRAQFRNRVEGIGLDTERYDSRAWQGAVETGYAFRVGGASHGGIYLEPQLQVGYSRWDSYRHAETNGTVVSAENADGLFGRAGVRLSGVTRWGSGTTDVQPYLAANWLHTRSESQIRMDDEVVDARIPRNRGEFSAGASLKFANGVGAWGGLSLQKASGFHQTSAQLGVSYSW